jgi:hypothetical protein
MLQAAAQLQQAAVAIAHLSAAHTLLALQQQRWLVLLLVPAAAALPAEMLLCFGFQLSGGNMAEHQLQVLYIVSMTKHRQDNYRCLHF